MIRNSFLLGMILLFSLSAQAQGKYESVKAGDAMRTPYEAKYVGSWAPEWDTSAIQAMVQHVRSENKDKDESELQRIKAGLMALKEKNLEEQNGQIPEKSHFLDAKKVRGVNDPNKISGFDLLTPTGVPSDNTVAINKNGRIMLMVNSIMRVYNTAGSAVNTQKSMEDFFSVPITQADLCDPKVIYDPQADRFIVFGQACSQSNFSYYSLIYIAFSASNDPAGTYHFYTLDGNLNDLVSNYAYGDVGFDYPRLATNGHDLFITGNMFDNSGDFKESIVFQMDKSIGYAGGNFGNNDILLWNQINNGPFTIIPAHQGTTGPIGNNMYLTTSINTSGGQGNYLNFYEISTYTQNNPTISLNFVTVPTYYQAVDVIQKGTGVDLNASSNRGMDAVVVNNVVHFVFHCSYFNGSTPWLGINYSRIYKNGNVWKADNTVFKWTNVDMAYPAVCHFGLNNNAQAVLISFNYASSNDFPGTATFFVDEFWVPSGVVDLRAGDSYASLGNPTRWGDYSGLCKDHSQANPTAWAYGMYGKTNHSWGNHMSQISSTQPTGLKDEELTRTSVNIYPNPVGELWSLEFEADGNGMLDVNLYDLNGRLVRKIYQHPVRSGKNLFTFNKGALATGNYFVNVKVDGKDIANEQIQVTE